MLEAVADRNFGVSYAEMWNKPNGGAKLPK
jgi:hypothetical protein